MKNPTRAQQLTAAINHYWTLQDRKKPRRKKAWHEHKGLAHYDRERMRQPLAPIVHPQCGFDGYSAPPSWAEIPDSWGEWRHPLPSGYFHQSGVDNSQPGDDLDAPPIAETDDYSLERCHVETVCSYRNPVWHRAGQPGFIRRRVLYRWELTFADGATFRFVSRAIAEAALSELLKIRKAKHPRPRYAKHSPESDCAFFTRKWAKLPADYVRGETPNVGNQRAIAAGGTSPARS